MAEKKAGTKKLGRGLGSLIGAPVSIEPPAPGSGAESAAAVEVSGPGIRMLPVADVVPNPRQPRQRFAEGSLDLLAESIRQAGLMQPIVVRPGAKGFEIVAGERRWRAFQRLGKSEIPAIVKSIDDQTAAEWALVENVQREDLDPLERADGIAQLMDDFGLSASAVASQISLDRSTVANLLRLRDADPDLRSALVEGLVTQGHAKALLGVSDVIARKKLLGECVRDGWSVRETERRVQQATVQTGDSSSRSVSEARARSPHVADLEKRLGVHLGTRVAISLGRKKGQGKMTINFFSLEQFDGLLERFGFDPHEE